MGIGVLLAVIIGLGLLILSPVSYYILRKNGHKKAAVIVSLFLVLIVLLPTMGFLFESELYFKSDARKDLKRVGVVLEDDFEIISNTIEGYPDYFQTTYLKISEIDKAKIIEKIRASKDFKILSFESKTLAEEMAYEESQSILWNYRQNQFYVKEFYRKSVGYTSEQLKILLQPNSDTLTIRVVYR